MTRTKAETLDVVSFAVHMAREFPSASGLPGKLLALMKECRKHAMLMERDCNIGDVTESKRNKLRGRIEALCADIGPGCSPIFSGDPRGATVKLKVPSGKTDDWGGVGLCVPGS